MAAVIDIMYPVTGFQYNLKFYFTLFSLDFYINSCTVIQGETKVPIIKDNCYSSTLSAKIDDNQNQHKVTTQSLFEWITFRKEYKIYLIFSHKEIHKI